MNVLLIIPILVIYSPLGWIGQRCTRKQKQHSTEETTTRYSDIKETELVETAAEKKEEKQNENKNKNNVPAAPAIATKEPEQNTEVNQIELPKTYIDPFSAEELDLIAGTAFSEWYLFVLSRFILVLFDLLFLPLLLFALCNPARAGSLFIVLRHGFPNQNIEIIDWYGFILRQALLSMLDLVFLPFTTVLYVTRWRWKYLENSDEDQKDIEDMNSLYKVNARFVSFQI